MGIMKRNYFGLKSTEAGYIPDNSMTRFGNFEQIFVTLEAQIFCSVSFLTSKVHTKMDAKPGLWAGSAIG